MKRFVMTYDGTESEVRLGDRVENVEVKGGKRGKVVARITRKGTVVCDLNRWECLRGHAYWLSQSEGIKEPGLMDRGVMVEFDNGEHELFSCIYDPLRLIRRQKVRHGHVVSTRRAREKR